MKKTPKTKRPPETAHPPDAQVHEAERRDKLLRDFFATERRFQEAALDLLFHECPSEVQEVFRLLVRTAVLAGQDRRAKRTPRT